MRRLIVLVGFVCISLLTLAQTTTPGTFSTAVPQNPNAIGGYVLTPPSINLGTDFSPAVITNMPAHEIANPEAVPAPDQIEPNSSDSNDLDVASRRPFDFIVAADNSIFYQDSSDGRSLAEVAAVARHDRVQARKTYTNQDITALNQRTGTRVSPP